MTGPQWTPAMHDVVEAEVFAAYEDGYRAGLAEGVAIGAVAAMTPDERDRQGYRDRLVAARIDKMAVSAVGRSTWHGVFPGGPVDWETGRPLRGWTSS